MPYNLDKARISDQISHSDPLCGKFGHELANRSGACYRVDFCKERTILQESKMGSLEANNRAKDPSSFPGAQRINNSFGITRESSIYSLTLHEFQNVMGGPGKNFGSMNMDELLKNIFSAEESQAMADNASDVFNRQATLQRQGSLTLPRTLSRKTVDEVWGDIHKTNNSSSNQDVASAACQRELTLGEMTLQDFLSKAGVVKEDVHGNSIQSATGNLGSGYLGAAIPKSLRTGISILGKRDAERNAEKENAETVFSGIVSPVTPSADRKVIDGYSPAPRVLEPQQYRQLPFEHDNAFARVAAIAQQQPDLWQRNAYVKAPVVQQQDFDSKNTYFDHKTAFPKPQQQDLTMGFSTPKRFKDAESPMREVGEYGGVGTSKNVGNMNLTPIYNSNAHGFASDSTSSPPSCHSPTYGSNDAAHDRTRNLNENLEKVIERRQRRMIKNRESAARSRARKQAYTVELETEVSELKEENRRLRKKQEEESQRKTIQFLETVAPMMQQMLPKYTRKLRRTRTGPW